MNRQDAVEQYEKALKEGMREYRECIQKKVSPSPIVLDDILEPEAAETSINVGLVDIPIDRIVGVKNAGRISAFTPTFRGSACVQTTWARKVSIRPLSALSIWAISMYRKAISVSAFCGILARPEFPVRSSVFSR